MTRVYDYFKLLFQTYKIFFKATLLISVVVVALTPLEALAPVLGVQAGQRLVDQLSAQQLNSLELFDDSDFFDDLEVLNEGASWRPVNLIAFGVAILREVVTISGMFWLLGKYNMWLALLLLGVLVPQTLVSYRIQQEAFETMVTRCQGSSFIRYVFSGDHTLSEII